ncbi:hypothetical protein ACFLS8_01120 [Chloroflexota bacterium]
MNEGEKDATPFKFSDSRQERIYRRLLLVGQGPAAFYRDACQLMNTKSSLSATTHLVSHLLREIESALRDVIEPAITKSFDSTEEKAPTKQVHRGEIEAVLKGLDIPADDNVAKTWMRLADKSSEYRLPRLAHRDTLTEPRPLESNFLNFWQDMETLLDIVLDRFEARYLEAHKLVDSLIAEESPTRKDAEVLRDNIPNNLATRWYFFDKIGVSWLKPLNDVGFFTKPSEPLYNYETSGYRIPVWPESRYLARVASIEPEIVLKIAENIPETENDHIHTDLIDIALQIPPKLSVRLARKAESWLKSRFKLIFPEKMGALVVYLAEGGEVDESVALAEKLLKVMPDSKKLDDDSSGDSFRLPPKPEIHFDEWHYQEILEKYMPRLVEIAGEAALSMLCSLLNDAIRLSKRKESEREWEDYSFMWRPQIDGHEQNHGRDIQDLLVSAVRDAAESMMNTKPKDVLNIIDAHSYKVFKRISLHLRWKWPKVDMEGTAQILTEFDVFEDPHMGVELNQLLQDLFDELPEGTQGAYLSFINSGPKLDNWIDFVTKRTSKKPSQEETKRHVRRWQYKHLWPIRAYLKADKLKQFEELKEEFGELDESEFRPFRMSTFWGSTSPKSLEELRSMSLDELIGFLKSWKASNGGEGPSKEGLSQTVKQLVSSDPEQFALNSEKLEGLSPIYINAILSSIGEAIKKDIKLPWDHILNICQIIIKKSSSDSGPSDVDDDEHSWSSGCRTVINTLSSGLEARENGIPLGLRSVVWEILEPLTHDPEPTLEYEAQYGGDNMDPLTVSINTNRGEALHAVIAYALWVQKLLRDGNKVTKPRGLDEIPEVRNVLDYHLDINVEKTLSIRAIYGAKFPLLHLLDNEWASNNVKLIFSPEDHLQKLHDAAWDAYITYNHAYSNVFDLLREEYSVMVERISETPDEKPSMFRPEEHLAEHLMVFYWQGRLKIGEPAGLLERFFKRAPDVIRGHAFSFIGRSIGNNEETIPKNIINRLKKLWENRISTVCADDALSSVELISFGWWFTSAKFDDSWAITQLLEVLKIAKNIEPDHRVLERLASLSKTYPMESVQSLGFIVEGDREGWKIHSWREEARTILTDALESKEKPTKEAAKDLINRLCAQGHIDYKELLS